MSQHPMNTLQTHRSRSPLTSLRAFAAAAGFGLAGFAHAAEPLPPGVSANPLAAARATPVLPDVVLARAALAALDAEAELRGVNVVVSVVDRVAVVGGAVGTARQSQRAEQIVRAVPGIADVRNTCFVSVGPDPLLKAVADRIGSSLPPRPVMVELPGVLTGTLQPLSPFPAPPVPGTNVVAINPPGTVVARRPPLAAGVSVLGAPVGPAGSNSAVVAMPPPAVPSTAPGLLTGAKPAEVLAAVNQLRKSEPRFAKLTVEMRDGVLVISGSAPLAADAWDFAQKLRAIPGATRIVVGAVVGK